MKRLTKILLINWHMFSCSEIEIKNNVLITGHNGAGKSTLLDAVQYVLTGGSKKFNLAANEDGARKLEGYVRGRLGMESQENLRNGDVTTHVALEFFDEEDGRPFVLGAVIDLPENGKCRDNNQQRQDSCKYLLFHSIIITFFLQARTICRACI